MTETKGMSIIVKTITRFTVWLIFLYGLYIIVHGHLTPGGGFAGGVIISLSFVHFTLAYGKEFFLKRHKISTLHNIEAGAGLAFIIIGMLGIAWAGSFLANFIDKGTLFTLKSAGTIPLLNIVIGAKAGMALYLVFYYLTTHRSFPQNYNEHEVKNEPQNYTK